MTERMQREALSEPARMILALLIATPLLACSQQTQSPAAPAAMSGLDLACIYTPSACNPGKFRDLYTSASDKPFETTFRGRPLVVPTGYVSDLVLIVDPRYPDIRNRSLPLVALGHELAPRSPSNVRQFFMPYDQRVVQIRVGARSPSAKPWSEVVLGPIAWPGEVLRPVAKPPQYGLSIVGEDFDRFPNRKPCARLGDDERTCRLHMDEVYRPLQPNGPPSVMICTAAVLPDPDAEFMAMSDEQQKAHVESKRWVGRRRTMCKHEMYYEPWDAHVSVWYSRHLLSHWREIEDNLRRRLASFEEAGQSRATAPSAPSR